MRIQIHQDHNQFARSKYGEMDERSWNAFASRVPRFCVPAAVGRFIMVCLSLSDFVTDPPPNPPSSTQVSTPHHPEPTTRQPPPYGSSPKWFISGILKVFNGNNATYWVEVESWSSMKNRIAKCIRYYSILWNQAEGNGSCYCVLKLRSGKFRQIRSTDTDIIRGDLSFRLLRNTVPIITRRRVSCRW